MNCRASNSLSSSPISNSSKLYKNLKKIKRNHGVENATKNYYLAFPALNSNNKLAPTSTETATTNSSGDNKLLFKDIEVRKEANLNLLSWSNLMSNKSENPSVSSPLVLENDKHRNVKTPRKRQRRYGKITGGGGGCNRFQKTDVQFTTKSFTMYDNATFSPKKMQMVKSSNNKKHQRNQYGK